MPKRQTIEMLDGRIYVSDDGWVTIYLVKPDGKRKKVKGEEADIVRLLHAHGASN